ncbi:MAG: selenoneine biosynthesis selenosugar synthase SenB [Ramlibacter sp.]
MLRSSVVIVSPALAGANNGNWQTANRWRRMLGPDFAARITSRWPDALADGDDILLALHARRSADSIAAWAQARGCDKLAVVLTGTDLYGDIAQDAQARRSLALASRLVVLQELGLAALPAPARAKARVIYQSTSTRQSLPKTGRWLRAVAVGHLRQVKSPQTIFEAARLLPPGGEFQVDHIGAATEPELGELARATVRDCPHYRWLGPMPHAAARRAIQRAHVLVHPSAVEGGAHVIMEAVCSGTPVLASRVDGNVGMLGDGYEGYFEHGNAAQLAAMLLQCRTSPLLQRLRAQCALRAPLFAPAGEQQAVLRLVRELDAAP